MILRLPITNDPAQTFITQLGDAKYQFEFKYNDISGTWSMDISDPITNTVLLAGVAVVTGGNLLSAYNLPLNNIFLVDTDKSGISGAPSPESFGDRLRLYWFSDDELENAG